MSKYAYAVRRSGRRVHCEGCGDTTHAPVAYTIWYAHHHAATCSDLHWRNWEAACPSCKAYGQIAPACPVCLGRGFERERDGLE